MTLYKENNDLTIPWVIFTFCVIITLIITFIIFWFESYTKNKEKQKVNETKNASSDEF